MSPTLVAQAQPLRNTYSAPQELRAAIYRLHRTSLARSVAAAVGDHVAIAALIALSLLAYSTLPLPLPLIAALNLVALVGVARFQRALESLVHEGSHYNWYRANHRRNDLLATLLAALPTISTVQQYRPAHLLHHRKLGTSFDPDLRRYIAFDIEALDRSSAWRMSLGIARRLPRYFVDWWGTIGTTRGTLMRALGWHGLVIFLPVTVLAGPGWAVAASASWLGAFTVILPVLRLIGEAGEHKYTGAYTLFDATMINEGWIHRLLIYPHNDGYHLPHHLWPGVPHHQLRRLHQLLEEHDPEGYTRRVRRRTRILEEPSPSGGRPLGRRRPLGLPVPATGGGRSHVA